MVRFTTVMMALHILQILLWAVLYRWQCLPSWESSFYISASSYATVGYGDIVLLRMWRDLGPGRECCRHAECLGSYFEECIGLTTPRKPCLAE